MSFVQSRLLLVLDLMIYIFFFFFFFSVILSSSYDLSLVDLLDIIWRFAANIGTIFFFYFCISFQIVPSYPEKLQA